MRPSAYTGEDSLRLGSGFDHATLPVLALSATIRPPEPFVRSRIVTKTRLSPYAGEEGRLVHVIVPSYLVRKSLKSGKSAS